MHPPTGQKIHRPPPNRAKKLQNRTQIHPEAAIFLPRTTRRLKTFNARGKRKMIVGLVLVSAVVGKIAVVAALALGLPTWMVVVTYPLICSLTLLLSAAIWNIRQSQPARAAQQLRPQT